MRQTATFAPDVACRLTKPLRSVQHDHVHHSALLLNFLASDLLIQRNPHYMDLSIVFYIVTSHSSSCHVSPAHNIAGKTVLFKRLGCRFLSCFVFITSFIEINTFHRDFILYEISTCIFIHISIICLEKIDSFVSQTLSFCNNKQPCGTTLERRDLVFSR